MLRGFPSSSSQTPTGQQVCVVLCNNIYVFLHFYISFKRAIKHVAIAQIIVLNRSPFYVCFTFRSGRIHGTLAAQSAFACRAAR
jgi:hypothetical protein